MLRCIDWVVWVIKFGARIHPFLLGAFMYSIKWDVIYLIDNQNIWFNFLKTYFPWRVEDLRPIVEVLPCPLHNIELVNTKSGNSLIKLLETQMQIKVGVKLSYHYLLLLILFRVDAVVMGSWCNGQLVVWAFIMILLLSSLWFIWNNSFCQMPAHYTSTAHYPWITL